MSDNFNLTRSITTALRDKKTKEQNGELTEGLSNLTVSLLMLLIDTGWYKK